MFCTFLFHKFIIERYYFALLISTMIIPNQFAQYLFNFPFPYAEIVCSDLVNTNSFQVTCCFWLPDTYQTT